MSRNSSKYQAMKFKYFWACISVVYPLNSVPNKLSVCKTSQHSVQTHTNTVYTMLYLLEFHKTCDENKLIYNKKSNIQISPPHFLPCLPFINSSATRLNRSMWVAIFPQKATTTVCLGFFINPSSMMLNLLKLVVVSRERVLINSTSSTFERTFEEPCWYIQ